MKRSRSFLSVTAVLMMLVSGCPRQTQAPESTTPRPALDSEQSLGDLRARGILRVSQVDPSLAIDGAEVSLRLLTLQRGQWFVGEDGASLQSGDYFKVKVKVELRSQLCVNLLYRAADGSVSLLYPMAGEAACLGAGLHKLPPPASVYGNMLRLDAQTGEELLFLVVTREPLADSDAQLERIVADARAGRDPALIAPPRAADGDVAQPRRRRRRRRRTRRESRAEKRTNTEASIVNDAMRSRGTVGVRSDGSTVDAVLGDDGVAVLMLSFEHVAG